MSKMKNMNPYLLFGLGVVGASYFSLKENRSKAKSLIKLIKEKTIDGWYKDESSDCSDLLEKAGNPDPYDIEDTKMVGEGAMYSVDYYNREEQQE